MGSPSRTEAGGIMDGKIEELKTEKKNPQDKYYEGSE